MSIAAIGHNNPPQTPFELIEKKITDLYDEAVLFLDGKPVDSDGVANDLGNLLDMIRKAHAEADDLRKQENEPFDKGKAEVQARYAALIGNTKGLKGKTVLATDACKQTLQPWLEKKDAEQRAAAELAQAEASAKAAEALRAHQEADAANLADKARADELLADAARAQKAANKATTQTAKAGGAIGRAAALRTVSTPEIVDPVAFARWVWFEHQEEMRAFLGNLARRLFAAGKRDMPGVTTVETKTTV